MVAGMLPIVDCRVGSKARAQVIACELVKSISFCSSTKTISGSFSYGVRRSSTNSWL